jgi:hypothetical protein
MNDPNVLTVPQAAKLLGRDPQTIRNWLKDESFHDAVVIQVPSGYPLISKPRLLRRLHGSAA